MGHNFGRDTVVIRIRVSQPCDTGVTSRSASIRHQARVGAQSGNPCAFLRQSCYLVCSHESSQIAPATRRERLAIPYPEIISNYPSTRQIKFLVPKLVIFVEIVSQ